MSEHRRKPPQPQGRRTCRGQRSRRASGRAAAQRRRHRAPLQARTASVPAPAERRLRAAEAVADAAEPSSAAAGAAAAGQCRDGRRKRRDERRRVGGAGRGRGRGRGRVQPPPKKRFIDYPRCEQVRLRRWVPSWKLVTGLVHRASSAADHRARRHRATRWWRCPNADEAAKAAEQRLLLGRRHADGRRPAVTIRTGRSCRIDADPQGDAERGHRRRRTSRSRGPGRRPDGHRPGAGQHGQGRRDAGRLDDHPAVREERATSTSRRP